MDDHRPANRIGRIACAALLAIVFGAGVTISTPVSDTAANMTNMLMEDSSLGGSRGQAGLKTPTPTPESCSSESDSDETDQDDAEKNESGARLIP
jgi:hypothetical protein